MTILSINITLAAERDDGLPVTSQDFLAPLNLNHRETGRWSAIADRPAGMTGLIVFYERALSEFTSGESHEEFAEELGGILSEIATWLSRIPNESFALIDGNGIRLRFHVETWIDQDQIELQIPASLLAELGSKGISAYIVSND